MGKLLRNELLLALIVVGFCVLFGRAYAGPGPVQPLVATGAVMGLTYMPIFALPLMAGKRMPPVVRRGLGLLLWVLLFARDFATLGRGGLAGVGLYEALAPVGFSLVVAVAALIVAEPGRRPMHMLDILYGYTFPMAIVRWMLMPMLRVDMLQSMALQAGAVYGLLRMLLRIFMPSPLESSEASPDGAVGGGGGGPVLRRPTVPDAIAGLIAGTVHRPMRPYATLPGGETEENVIAVLCTPGEVDQVLAKLAEALQGRPFQAERGQVVGGQVEVVVRPGNP